MRGWYNKPADHAGDLEFYSKKLMKHSRATNICILSQSYRTTLATVLRMECGERRGQGSADMGPARQDSAGGCREEMTRWCLDTCGQGSGSERGEYRMTSESLARVCRQLSSQMKLTQMRNQCHSSCSPERLDTSGKGVGRVVTTAGKWHL